MKTTAYMKRLPLFMLLFPILASAQLELSWKSIPNKPIAPTMWGLFYEDINRSGDGGLYAELIKNNSFDFPDPFMGWNSEPSRRNYARNEVFQVMNRMGQTNNPKFLRVTKSKQEKILLSNESYGGLTTASGKTFTLSIVCKQVTPGLQIESSLLNASGKVIGKAILAPSNNQLWQTLDGSITTTDTALYGKIQLSFIGIGSLDIDRISLFPNDTWMNRQWGLRKDLVQKLYDLQPGFFRFPGGCIVEGKNTENRYQWKNTIGDWDERTLIANQWQEGAAGPALKDYFQSFGLGFYEYFQLCEDLKASPMPIINCGISCQFDAAEIVPMDQMATYVQDALDLIEFANGSAQTKWGKRRASLGHPAPFNMQYLGVGNENWGPQYLERFNLFSKAIKAKYPNIQLVCATGYSPNPQFKYMDSALRSLKVDIIDEHYYQTIPWMMMNAGKYDNYDRKGPKIFIGEYACTSVRIGNKDNKNTLLCALAEACFMTGLERNADIVTMAAYAPLFAHVKDWQWTPNLIWFDNATSYATPSYYVQQLFSKNKGTRVINLTQNGEPLTGKDSIWASAVVDDNKQELIIKLVNPSSTAKRKTIQLVDGSDKPGIATAVILSGSDPNGVNDIREENIKPAEKQLIVSDKKLVTDIPAYGMQVIRISIKL